MSDYIPNSFQTPNILIDSLMPLLSGDEWKVLSYMTRHILGFTDRISSRQHTISLTMFTKGYSEYPGCGLGQNAVRAALDILEKVGIILKVGNPGSKGQIWKLAFDSPAIDLEFLKHRQDEFCQQNKKRTSKARSVRHNPSVPHKATVMSGHKATLMSRHKESNTLSNTLSNTVSGMQKKAPRNSEKLTALKDAIASAFQWEWERMTKAEKGKVQAAAADLYDAQVDPALIPALHAECERRFDQFGPNALTSVVSDVRASAAPAPVIPQTAPAKAQMIELSEEQIRERVEYSRRMRQQQGMIRS